MNSRRRTYAAYIIYNSSTLSGHKYGICMRQRAVFFYFFKSCKTFTWLYVKWKWIPNFWSKMSNAFSSKGYLIYNGNFYVKFVLISNCPISLHELKNFIRKSWNYIAQRFKNFSTKTSDPINIHCTFSGNF